MPESTHKKLGRVRPPRVHITYEVETGDAVVLKELPFVVGVMGDFSGNPDRKLEPLGKRKFVQIDRDNFNDVMARLSPELNIRVENTLQDDGSELSLQLKFGSIDDFSPAAVASQVPALKKLVDTRNKLRDLITKVDRSQDLESLLEEVLNSSDKLGQLAQELGTPSSQGAQEE